MMKDMGMVKCTGQMAASIRVNGQKEYSMVMGKCIFLMALRRLAFLRIMFLKEDLSNLILNKNRLLFDLLLNQVQSNKTSIFINQHKQIL